MSRELKLRTISAIVLAILAIFSTWMGGKVFACVVIVAGFLIYYEWSTITALRSKSIRANGVAWLTLVLSFSFLLFDLPIYAFVVLLSGAAVAMIFGARQGVSAVSVAGIFYAGFPVIALTELRGDGLFGLFAVIFVLSIVWATDIFAYFCGKAIGGRKLAPAISPGKTWSGAIFGLAAGVGVGLISVMMLRYGGGIFVPIVAAVISISGQIGDLFESWIKRRYGVKDSSQLIPGHGGFMDRLDGVIFAAIIAFVIATLNQYYSGIDSSSILAVHLLDL
jgi:phosphatidate cytidylyltransferase